MTPLARPAGRRDAAMAYDPVLRQLLLFGGIPTGYGVELADSWLWVGGADTSPLAVVTVSGNPPRCSVAVDGTTFASPQAFTWAPGSLHTIAAPSHQPDTGTRCTFTSWSDGGAVSHQVTAPATATTLVATFGTQYKLTLSVTPGGAGTITPSPPSGDGFYAGGTDVVLTAMPRAGQYLSNVQINYSWVGIQNPWTVTLSGPVQVTAQFSQISSFGPSAAAVLGTTAGTIVWDMFDDSLPPDESGVGFTGKPSASRSGAQLIVSRNTYSQLALLEYQAYYPNKFNVYTLGGSFQGDPAIAAGENYSDMYAAVRDYSNGYWLIHVSYPSSAPDWTFLGGQFATDPVMARAADGTIYIAGKDNWQSTWVGRFTALTGFKGWKNLGGILRSKLALTVGQDGIAYIAGVDPWYGMWLMRTQSDQVLGWYPARGVFRATRALRLPATEPL